MARKSLKNFDVDLDDCSCRIRFLDYEPTSDFWRDDCEVSFGAEILPGCCGVAVLYEPEFVAFDTNNLDKYSPQVMRAVQAALEKGLERAANNRSTGIGKLIMADVEGGWVDMFCKYNKWYCSPFRSINPKTGNSICVYEFALPPKKEVV